MANAFQNEYNIIMVQVIIYLSLLIIMSISYKWTAKRVDLGNLTLLSDKHSAFTQFWLNVGPASQTVSRNLPSICLMFAGRECHIGLYSRDTGVTCEEKPQSQPVYTIFNFVPHDIGINSTSI